MKKRIFSLLILSLFIVFVFSGCTNPVTLIKNKIANTQTDGNESENGNSSVVSSTDINFEFDENDKKVYSADDNFVLKTLIGFSDSSVTVSGSGATAKKGTVTITKGGIYVLSGEGKNVNVVVDSNDKNIVFLVLNGISISNESSAPISVLQAKKTVVTLQNSTSNTINDLRSESTVNSESNDENAALYSSDDLTINGNGTLTVASTAADGINCRDTLKAISANITVNDGDDGIVGKDLFIAESCTFNISANDDGIKSTNSEDATLGCLGFKNCDISISSECDAIQAERSLLIAGGNYSFSTGGGSINSSTSSNGNINNDWRQWGENGQSSSEDSSTSAKGLKAGASIIIESGRFSIDSSDDSIHSNGTITIENGDFNLSSGDDGIHADTSLTINDGKISILKSYEGLESNNITINGGSGNVYASDDGINVNGGNDQSSMGGRHGENSFSEVTDGETPMLTITGGEYYINADGDGLDSNGSITMSGGKFYVDGPSDNGNGALDYNNEFTMTGGVLAAIGSSGMMQTPSNNSTINCISAVFNSANNGGTAISILDESGKSIITVNPAKQYNSAVIASPDIETGKTYTVSYGGSITDNSSNGFVSDNSYSGGTELSTVTVTSVISSIGSPGGFGGGGFGGGGGMGKPSR